MYTTTPASPAVLAAPTSHTISTPSAFQTGHGRHTATIRIDQPPATPGRGTHEQGGAAGHGALRDAPMRDGASGNTGGRDVCVAIREHMVGTLGHNRVRRYLNASTEIRMTGPGAIEIAAGDSFSLDMIQRRLGDALRIGAQFAMGTTEPAIRFSVDPTLSARPGKNADGRAPQVDGRDAKTAAPGRGNAGLHPLATPMPSGGRPRSSAPPCPTLEHFLVGSGNRLALESVKQAVESVSACPPVFVHGSCGVGKTHLLRGATLYARRLRPGCRVRYTTGEAFTNAFVTAIRTRTVEAFQKKYRGLDLLCIDDIHLMAGKQATQHELLQIFNTLSLGGARIILASDAHPREIARLDQALASRFAAGMVVRVEDPDAELAGRLVTHIAHKRGVFFDDAAVRVIVERVGIGCGASVRDLEGAVLQIQAVARLMDKGTPRTGSHASGGNTPGSISPTMNHVRQALSLRCGGDQQTTTGPIALETIISRICSEMTVSHPDLLGKGRQKKVVMARELIVHIARNLTSKSFPEIAHAIGRPNHSTVITAAKRFRDRLGVADPILVGCPHDGIPAAELAQLMTRRINQSPA